MPVNPVRDVVRLTGVLRAACGKAAAAGLLRARAGGGAEARISWKSGAEPTVVQSRAALQESLEGLALRGAGRHVVVQLSGPVTDAARANFRAAGLTLQTFLGDNAFFAVAGERVNAASLLAEPLLVSVQESRRAWKLDPLLENDVMPSWAVVSVNKKEGMASDPVFGAYVHFHPDVDFKTEAVNTVLRYGGRVVSPIAPLNAYVVEIPLSRAKAFAADDSVLWLEAAKPQFDETRNPSNRWRTGANIVQAAPYNLSGAGVKVMIYDGGTARATHQDFGGRLTNRDSTAVSGHTTHVSGTVGGSGAASGGTNRGMAPGVTLNVFGFQWSGGNDFLYTNPGDMLQDYTTAVGLGCVVANNSIGNNTSTNGNPCSWLGDYATTDALIDGIVRGQAGGPMRICWAAGNERQSTACQGSNGGFYTTAPPSNNKNAIVVGALNSNDDSITSFTSWGPSDDGRLKPDVSSTGCQNGVDGIGTNDSGVTSTTNTSDTAYAVLCGTSMATPTVTGLVALMLEDFRAQNPSRPDPLNSTIKAVLAHTAADVGNPGPDYKTGYGSVRIQPAIDFMRGGSPGTRNFIEGSATQGSTTSVFVIVNPGDPAFKATLAWDDYPAASLVSVALVNDLDLRVFDPNGVRRFPWTLNPASPNANAVQTQEDHRNNMEQVFVANPVPGTWRVEIAGTAVPQGPQSFSLAASGTLVNCTSTGVASLDKQVYPCGAAVICRVTDCDLNTNPNVPETVTVNLASTSNPAGIPVVLTETGANTSLFQATVATGPSGSGAALIANNGDTITLTYIDASSPGGSNLPRIATATVDCAAPVISNVQVSAIGPDTATVAFTTNENATDTLSYGAACGSLGTTLNGAAPSTSHSYVISGLNPNTAYYFNLTATDAAGNTAIANNGGSCFTFSTTAVPNYFTQQFVSGTNNLNLSNKTITFRPNGSNDYYAACITDNSALPVEPTNHASLAFTPNNDDGSSAVTLSGGAAVRLYGTPRTNFWVGTNGYITFTASDVTYTPSLAAHFTQPRVSGLFRDLNVLSPSSVRYAQLADSVVVTWLNVPQFSASGSSNTFQIQMFFDGRIMISYRGLTATDGIVGLSNRTNVPNPFFQSNFIGLSACRAPCPADIDGDGMVTFNDLNIILGSFGQTGVGLPGDVDHDGAVTFADLNIVLGVFGTTCP